MRDLIDIFALCFLHLMEHKMERTKVPEATYGYVMYSTLYICVRFNAMLRLEVFKKKTAYERPMQTW